MEPSYPVQLAFDLAHRPAFGAEDFFLSKSNEMAVRLIDGWQAWGQYGQILVGPPASGKTHLVNVWRLQAGAAIFNACDFLDRQVIKVLEADQPVCIEDIDRELCDETALFHVLNRARELQGRILLSTRREISHLPFELPDLRSRLLVLPSVSINAPDDTLLKAVMIKQFADRQIRVEPRLVEYLFRRMERSMQAVSRMVDLLDRGALRMGRPLTKPLAREIMNGVGRS